MLRVLQFVCEGRAVGAYEGEAAGGVWGKERDGHVALFAKARDPQLHCVEKCYMFSLID